MARPAILSAAPGTWHSEALAYVCGVALESGRVHADDLRAWADQPEHANAIGRVFQAASRRGLLEPVGHRRSRAKSRRGSGAAEWAPTPALRARGLDALNPTR